MIPFSYSQASLPPEQHCCLGAPFALGLIPEGDFFDGTGFTWQVDLTGTAVLANQAFHGNFTGFDHFGNG